jgi:hypothetical protein
MFREIVHVSPKACRDILLLLSSSVSRSILGNFARMFHIYNTRISNGTVPITKYDTIRSYIDMWASSMTYLKMEPMSHILHINRGNGKLMDWFAAHYIVLHILKVLDPYLRVRFVSQGPSQKSYFDEVLCYITQYGVTPASLGNIMQYMHLDHTNTIEIEKIA